MSSLSLSIHPQPQVVLKININQYPSHAKYAGVHIDLHAQCDRSLGIIIFFPSLLTINLVLLNIILYMLTFIEIYKKYFHTL